jgi:hypothetical protein
MKRVYFHGRILPESKLLEIDEIPQVQWRDKERPSTTFNASIVNNRFVVTCARAPRGPYCVGTGTAKGYQRAQFDDAFGRYLPPADSETATS